MSTDTTLEIVSHGLEDTLKLARKIGSNLNGGETIELASDIGGGKTAFVRGLADGINSPDNVASPTFTLSRHYKSGDGSFEIRHFDFYRLDDPGLMKAELAESLNMQAVVVVVEWSDIVNEVLPDDRLRIEISSTGEDTRHLKLTAGRAHKHLLNGLKRS